MKKHFLYSYLIIILAVLVVVVYWIVRAHASRDHGKLVSFSYHYGGDMNGSSTGLTVAVQEDGQILVTKTHADMHYQDETVTEYLVPEAVLREIGRIYDTCGMYSYPDLPMTDVFALDAGTSSYYFDFEDSEHCVFSDNQRIPQSGLDGLRDMFRVIEEATAQAELLPGLVTPPQEDDCPPIRVTEGAFTLSVFRYQSGRLFFRIANGLEEPQHLSALPLMYGQRDGDWELLFIGHPEVGAEIAPMDYQEFSMEAGRLAPGTYCLTVGDLQGVFEIQ